MTSEIDGMVKHLFTIPYIISFNMSYFNGVSQANQIILILWSGFLFTHIAFSLYIIYKDVTKQWDKFRLVKSQNKDHDRLSKYLKCLPYLMRDFLIIFPIILYYYVNHNLENLLKETTWTDLLIKTPIAYLINKFWAMLVHLLIHKNNYLYKLIHETHHVKLEELCCLASWKESLGEFLLMEIPGFNLGLYFFKLNWLSHLLVYLYVAIGGTIDHCNYKVNAFFDPLYHFYHHKKPNYNFAEFEFYDKIFGTLYIEKAKNCS